MPCVFGVANLNLRGGLTRDIMVLQFHFERDKLLYRLGIVLLCVMQGAKMFVVIHQAACVIYSAVSFFVV